MTDEDLQPMYTYDVYQYRCTILYIRTDEERAYFTFLIRKNLCDSSDKSVFRMGWNLVSRELDCRILCGFKIKGNPKTLLIVSVYLIESFTG